MSELSDINLVCVNCKMDFTWTKGEQRFLNTLLSEGKIPKVNQPKRCVDCRAAKRAKTDNGQTDF